MDDRAGIDHSPERWQERLPGTIGAGHIEPLGPHHAAIRAGEDKVLLVSFERGEEIRAGRADGAPLAATLTEAAGWSRLTLVADRESWFRDPAVYAFFDRLVDQAYFDDFDRVVFYGAGMCGYAAAAFSVAAPGATVIALNPQATLDPTVAGWDGRFLAARRLDFTTRYGYAPAMAEAANRVFIFYDPTAPLDAMHAALFSGPNVTRLRAPQIGPAIQTQFLDMGVLPELIDAAGEDMLSPMVYHRLFRARRTHMPYLRALTSQLNADGQTWRAALVCRYTAREKNAPRFQKRLLRLEDRLTQEGLTLPQAPFT